MVECSISSLRILAAVASSTLSCANSTQDTARASGIFFIMDQHILKRASLTIAGQNPAAALLGVDALAPQRAPEQVLHHVGPLNQPIHFFDLPGCQLAHSRG